MRKPGFVCFRHKHIPKLGGGVLTNTFDKVRHFVAELPVMLSKPFRLREAVKVDPVARQTDARTSYRFEMFGGPHGERAEPCSRCLGYLFDGADAPLCRACAQTAGALTAPGG